MTRLEGGFPRIDWRYCGSGHLPRGITRAFDRGMSTIKSFRDLLVWQKAMALAEQSYRLSVRFQRPHQDVLGFQIRKSAVSIPSNIAEGFCRHSTALYIQHLWIAHASGAELETQLELAGRTAIVPAATADVLIGDTREIARMLNGLVASLERGRDR